MNRNAPLRRKTPLRPSSKPIRAHNPNRAAHKRAGNSTAHRRFVAQLPCCITGKREAVHAHHLKSGPASEERGVGMKATDKWLVPLHWEKHLLGVELRGSRREIEWFHEQGIADPHKLAAELAEVSGDFEAAERIIFAHRNGGSIGF